MKRPHKTKRPRLAAMMRRWRKEQKLSQSQAALKLGVPLCTLQNWEQQRSAPRGFALAALIHAIR